MLLLVLLTFTLCDLMQHVDLLGVILGECQVSETAITAFLVLVVCD